MTPECIGPLVIVVSRNEIERNDTSAAMATLKRLLLNRENIRAFCTRVDLCFDGFDHTREELFEIPQVRNFVYALNEQFPYWLYFLSREFLGLHCLAHCFLPPHLTAKARMMVHPERLSALIDKRWGPALFHICTLADQTEAEADELLQSALQYFASGPINCRHTRKQSQRNSAGIET